MDVRRSDFDLEHGRYSYFVCFRPGGCDEAGEQLQTLPVLVSLSVSENGDLADLSFELPKTCRSDAALSFIRKESTAQAVNAHVFVTVPGLSGDAVLNSSADLQLDPAGRIVGVVIYSH
ncbi:MAG TPA: hypothetical protein VFA60_04990 [Terriglobales bacterium]|nr:hypothetical protein [Terriglobales bacterium]